jgi:hypothetical protein
MIATATKVLDSPLTSEQAEQRAAERRAQKAAEDAEIKAKAHRAVNQWLLTLGLTDPPAGVNARDHLVAARDVSEDIANEVLERAFDADDNLCENTKRFILGAGAAGRRRWAEPGNPLPSAGVGRP